MNTLETIKKTFLATSIILSLTTASTVRAADFDFSGTFTNDNDVLRLDFSVGSDSNITIFSSSWDDGGFDPILSIWDSSGQLIAQQDDGYIVGQTSSNDVVYTHGSWDSYYTQFLTAGNYTATIAQYSNFAVGTNLSQGFWYDGVGNENFTSNYGCSNGQFCGVWTYNDNRTNEWAFHILNVDDAVIIDPVHAPEPSSLLGLIGIGVIGLTVKRTKG
jgi:hypothetical protein